MSRGILGDDCVLVLFSNLFVFELNMYSSWLVTHFFLVLTIGKKTIPVLANSHKSMFNWSHWLWILSPNPCEFGDISFYTFEIWATQLYDFCVDVVKDEASSFAIPYGNHLFDVLLCRWILWFPLIIFGKCLLLILVIYACL